MKSIQIVAGIIAGALLTPSLVFAHEHQQFIIGGKTYEFVVGSLGEPVIVDDKTGVDLRVTTGGVPVEGLESALKVEIIAGDAKRTFDLTTVYGAKGSYKAIFFPTVATTLTYRLFGTLNNVPVDLSFACNPAGHVVSPEDKTEVKLSDGVTRIHKSGQFGCPQAKSEFGFPEESWSLRDLHGDAEHHMGALMKSVESTASRSSTGIALGALGVLLGALALYRSRKS